MRMRHAVRSASIRQKRNQGKQNLRPGTARHGRERGEPPATLPYVGCSGVRNPHYALAGGASISLVSLWCARLKVGAGIFVARGHSALLLSP